jgi:ATP-binding protein involved in chromosome partitioning
LPPAGATRESERRRQERPDRGEAAGHIIPPAVQYLSSLASGTPRGAVGPFGGAAHRLLELTGMPTAEQIQDALSRVIDPELRKDIVSLGMVRSVEQPEPGRVDVVVSLTTPGCPIRNHFQQAVAQNVSALEGVTEVNVGFDVLSDQEKQSLAQRLGRQGGLPEGALAQVKNVICVGSGKGGVGKSTVTANLATALQADGKLAAALDADVWGYSIPRMLGVHGRPLVSAERKILPLDGPGGVKAISIEFFLNERDQAITWRGPMLHKAIRQFLEDVDWGELDYLLIDLPPGTGDVSMTLAQLLPQAKFVIVTTPQPAAQKVAARAAETALRFDLEIAGVIENMSGFTTPAGERFTIFGEGGGQLLADELDVPLLGKIPLQEELRVCADEGRPLVLEDPDAPASQALFHAARGIVAATPQELAVLQAPSGPPVPQVTGTALPMAP